MQPRPVAERSRISEGPIGIERGGKHSTGHGSVDKYGRSVSPESFGVADFSLWETGRTSTWTRTSRRRWKNRRRGRAVTRRASESAAIGADHRKNVADGNALLPIVRTCSILHAHFVVGAFRNLQSKPCASYPHTHGPLLSHRHAQQNQISVAVFDLNLVRRHNLVCRALALFTATSHQWWWETYPELCI